jgi:hypothetical protein
MLVRGPALAPLVLPSPTYAALTSPGAMAQPPGSGALHVGAVSFSAALHAAMSAPMPVPQPRRGGPRSEATELDPASRQAAHLAPPVLGAAALVQPRVPTSATETTPTLQAAPPASLEEILPALVRKIAWSGDARRGAVRIELGSGALAGATLLVAADHGRVKVTLSGHAGALLEPWRERIAMRLAAKGLDVDVT